MATKKSDQNRGDKIHELIKGKMAELGWAMVFVMSDGESPGYVYTIGLFEKYQHPEIILFGIPDSAAHPIIHNIVNDYIKKEAPLLLTKIYDEVARGLDVCFVPVIGDAKEDFMGGLYRHYPDTASDIPVIQLIWPDPDNNLPWDLSFDRRYEAAQPLLGIPDQALVARGPTPSMH